MNPTFTKLYAAAKHAKACEPALTAIQTATNWDELCAHPKINEWAIWFVKNVKECASLDVDYQAKCASLDADYHTKRDSLYADYDAKHAPLYADYEAKRAPLYAELIANIRAQYEI